jgi:hypothetical protein
MDKKASLPDHLSQVRVRLDYMPRGSRHWIEGSSGSLMLIDTEYLVACVLAYSGFSQICCGRWYENITEVELSFDERENFPFRILNLSMILIDG